MGCTGSRHASRLGGGGRSPHARSYSGPVARVAHHTVALRSSTLGSLSLDHADAAGGERMMKSRNDLGAAKPQPVRRQRQMPCTPSEMPAQEAEVINVWELMEGLDDNDEGEKDDGHEAKQQEPSAPGSVEFDPDILAAFRKAIDELSPPRDDPGDGPFVKKREIQKFPGIVRARVDAFQQKIDAKLAKKVAAPPESPRRVVVYLTSLRGIRKTYEDCWATRFILQGYGVHVDERDLSMHAGYKHELHAALGSAAFVGKLPQVFADGKYLGGAEEVRRLHEAGELARTLDACEMAPCAAGKGIALEACGGCGGVRFVPCEACSGSCKVFVEGGGGFRRCPECNENGLIRCPLCCL